MSNNLNTQMGYGRQGLHVKYNLNMSLVQQLGERV